MKLLRLRIGVLLDNLGDSFQKACLLVVQLIYPSVLIVDGIRQMELQYLIWVKPIIYYG